MPVLVMASMDSNPTRDDLTAKSYRALVRVDPPRSALEDRWNEVVSTAESYWERIVLRGEALGLRLDGKPDLLLASFGPTDLPVEPASTPALGRWLARRSPFARILSARAGREEVTFYALANRAHGSGLNARLDRLLLEVGHAPLCYRRKKVVEILRRSLLDWLRAGRSDLGFLDLGSGGGFDGLDILRITSALSAAPCRIINVDVDARWLALNERIAALVGAPRIIRRHASAFDYLDSDQCREDLAGISHLMVSCNGFADFLPDDRVRALLRPIRRILGQVSGAARFVFPAALKKNRLQTWLGRSLGFNYTGRTRSDFEDLVESSLGQFTVRFEERYSQMICVVEKG